MGLVTETKRILSKKYAILQDLQNADKYIAPLVRVAGYNCVEPRNSRVDPRHLELMEVRGDGLHPEFCEQVRESARHLVTRSVERRILRITEISGCTATKSRPQYRLMREWGDNLRPEWLSEITDKRSLTATNRVHFDLCVNRSWRNRADEVYHFNHLTWARGGGLYWENEGGSHHAAYALSLADRYKYQVDLKANITVYRMNEDLIDSLVMRYGAYVFQGDSCNMLVSELRRYRVPFARSHIGIGSGELYYSVIYVDDKDVGLSPIVAHHLDGLTDKGKITNLSRWSRWFVYGGNGF